MTLPDRFEGIREEVLRDIDNYIATKCTDPDAPYYPTFDGVDLSIRQVREHIFKSTDIGREAAESWAGMREAERARAQKK